MKVKFFSLKALLALSLLGAPLLQSSCSSSSSEEETLASDDGVTASEFASGAVTYNIFRLIGITLQPVSSSTVVNTSSLNAYGVDGFIVIGDTSIPVLLNYLSEGNLTTTGIVSAEIHVTLADESYTTNADLLTALGAPTNSRFVDCVFTVNYLSKTLSVVTTVNQSATLEPDAPGSGDLITGGGYNVSVPLNNLNFYYSTND